MIDYKIATLTDMDLLMASRLEMLKVVNDLPEDYVFSDELVNESRKYFEDGDQTTVLAIDDGKFIGCATICYIHMMPTFSRIWLMKMVAHLDLAMMPVSLRRA